jgi:uncharacterized protein (TIGR00369 family)
MILPELIPGYRKNIATAVEAMPAFKLLGMEVVGFGEGVSVIALPIKPEVTFDGRTVQGGIIGVLADFAGVTAAIAATPEQTTGSTTSYNVHNLVKATGTRLLAIGKVVNISQTSAVASANIFALNDTTDESKATLVATALITCKLVSPR